MKKYLLTLIILILSIESYAQKGIFYQASYFRSLYQEDTKKITIDNQALDAVKNLYAAATIEGLVDSLNKNPFTVNMFAVQAAGGNNSFSFSSAIGGLDVTNLANGLSDFLIKRAKQELTLAFFNRFKKFSEENPEFKILFPKTTANLSNLLDYAYPQMLPALRTGFLEDLKNVTYKLDDVLNLPRYNELLKNLPEIKVCLRSIKLVHQLESGLANPAEVLREFSLFPEWHDPSATVAVKNIGSTLGVATLLSESIKADITSHADSIWVPAKELRRLLDDEVFLKIYVGLVYRKAQMEKIEFFAAPDKSRLFSDILLAQKDNLLTLRSGLSDLFDLTSGVNALVSDIITKKRTNAVLTNDDYYNYINTSIDFIGKANAIVKNYVSLPLDEDYFDIAKKSNEIYKDVYTRKYAQLFSDALDVFDHISNTIDKRPEYQDLMTKASITDYKGKEKNTVRNIADVKAEYTPVKESVIDTILSETATNANLKLAVANYRLKQLVNFFKELKPYGLFMADMVGAEKPEEVQAALENAVLPVGSSSVKKNTNSNLSVQAYLGAYLSNKNNSFSSWTSKFGVIAPIGISYTPGFLSWKSAGSLSFFGSLIDLGAIVDYKLKKDSTISSNGSVNTNTVSKDYKIKLGQIFSPGAFVVYGFFGNLPLSLGVGGQYGPGLSKINVDNTTVLNNPSWRWSVFLAVDIPFFNLHNKMKSK
ncbi:transporter family protein [Mucilaginibacter kameinonensis]|uniref:transporter n=1 Tax=Mucilaginibacter kameinonensis TaxID=452286 RepID=UPI000EF7D44E|nr:transporter [Mucilaginibacter kameinonensis]